MSDYTYRQDLNGGDWRIFDTKGQCITTVPHRSDAINICNELNQLQSRVAELEAKLSYYKEFEAILDAGIVADAHAMLSRKEFDKEGGKP